jgi:hypothetical protein
MKFELSLLLGALTRGLAISFAHSPESRGLNQRHRGRMLHCVAAASCYCVVLKQLRLPCLLDTKRASRANLPLPLPHSMQGGHADNQHR